MRDEPPDLAALDRKLRAARETQAPSVPDTSQRQVGMAYRVFVELIAGLAVGGVGGWALDYWLGTRPWLMIVMVILGLAAGMNNLWRTIQRMDADAKKTDG